MKKLDLHIHTICTGCDPQFEFSLSELVNYVQKSHLNCIAVTNHNIFDINQYYDIARTLHETVVLPGIEINIGSNNVGHMICIADVTDVEDFAQRCEKIKNKIENSSDWLSVDELKTIFHDMERYLWIPHYDKKPVVDKQIISELSPYIVCGEVGSIKKFKYHSKDRNSLTPVYFSDFRPKEGVLFPVRQTYVDISDISVKALNYCLSDKTKVALSEQDGNKLFEILPGLPLSTGLNIIIGERSSGKSYTLNEIYNYNQDNDIKYIHQFELLETDPEKAEKDFTNGIARKKNSAAEDFLSQFASAVNITGEVSLQSDEAELDNYITSLVRYAKYESLSDMFSKCKIYSEHTYSIVEPNGLKDLIQAVEKLLDATEYREIIEKYIDRKNLVELLQALCKQYRDEMELLKKKTWVNGVITEIQNSLQARTAAPRVTDTNFYDLQMHRAIVKKFNELVPLIKKNQIISSEDLNGFTIQIRKKEFANAKELKDLSGKRSVRFSEIFKDYQDNPYEFLTQLMKMEEIPDTDYYKYFSRIEYKILNQYGFEVSGGERSEFNLLREIKDALQYDMLLIDEPESSFDNIFLKDKVNEIIKTISQEIPVLIVTHNNTVGESIKPDYIVYTKRNISEDGVTYKRFYGYPSDKALVSCDGDTVNNYCAIMDCLEAGEDAYKERGHDYEILKN